MVKITYVAVHTETGPTAIATSAAAVDRSPTDSEVVGVKTQELTRQDSLTVRKRPRTFVVVICYWNKTRWPFGCKAGPLVSLFEVSICTPDLPLGHQTDMSEDVTEFLCRLLLC